MVILDEIKKEFMDISKQNSLIQKAIISVEIREACITKINNAIDKIT